MDKLKQQCKNLQSASSVNLKDGTSKITLGICGMSQKTASQSMQEILTRLNKNPQLGTVVFEENVILNSPVEEWPVVDGLLAFYSKGFPLRKAITYKRLRKPIDINDLESQFRLLDRREVYKTLDEHCIPHPRSAVLNRDDGTSPSQYTIADHEDVIEIDNEVFHKPFVEKPVSAEDHNVYIYFPSDEGGGSRRLFKKVGQRCSEYSTVSSLRRSGSYIYESFIPTNWTDVKVYTVGPDYAHAEARKAPGLEGEVETDETGKEKRYPVTLSQTEKLIAKQVCLAFKQNLCCFDLLRSDGISYVCDVNGFRLVKSGDKKYHDDCARVLGAMILKAENWDMSDLTRKDERQSSDLRNGSDDRYEVY